MLSFLMPIIIRNLTGQCFYFQDLIEAVLVVYEVWINNKFDFNKALVL